MVHAARDDLDLNKPLTIRFPGAGDRGVLRIACDIARQTGKELAQLIPSGNVLCVADPIITASTSFLAMIDAVKAEGYGVVMFTDIEPEPSCQVMEHVGDLVRQGGIKAVVGVGGGSTLDTAKFAAILGACSNMAVELLHNDALIKNSLPLILMPTTSGTGSEVSPYIVVSDAKKKYFITNNHACASVALVDPLLTMSMPPRLTAYTGLDALAHAVEGLIGNDNPFTSALAYQAVGMIFKYLPRVVGHSDDVVARYNMSFAAVLGMLAYMQGGGLYAHSMSYVLTESHGFPHGLGCGLALPYTLRFNAGQIGGVLEQLGSVIGPFTNAATRPFAGSLPTLSAEAVPAAFSEFVELLGIPNTLRDAGIQRDELPAFASALVTEYPRAKNPRQLTPDLADILVDAMFDGTIDSIPTGGLI
jgi:alcohol dehydrogenase class IV